MIYASKTVITDDMNASSIAQSYPIWNAQYNDTDTLTVKHSYWQYSDVGKVSGISNATDMNFRYVKSPAAPSSLTQSACTDSTITLTWTKIPEVYAYQIVRYDSSEDKYVSVGTPRVPERLHLQIRIFRTVKSIHTRYADITNLAQEPSTEPTQQSVPVLQ